ncbi:hypothetical protein Q5752_000694 [Cryptotrichosporon argae]
MTMRTKLVLLLALAAAAAASPLHAAQVALGDPGPSAYAGDQVWRVQLSSLDAAERVRVLEAVDALDLDVWSATPAALDVCVPPLLQPIVASLLPHGAHTVFISDLSPLIAASEPAAPGSALGPNAWDLSTLATPFHDAFHRLDEIERFEEELESQFAAVERFEVGRSAEGRSVWGLRARLRDEEAGGGVDASQGESRVARRAGKAGRKSRKNGKGGKGRGKDGKSGHGKGGKGKADEGPSDMPIPRPPLGARDGVELEILVQTGSHAREWVGPASALYFIHSLVVDATADNSSHAAKLLRAFTVTVIPTINPDGYVYSHEHARMWRKNRQPAPAVAATAAVKTEAQSAGARATSELAECTGIDLNSNWGYRWQPSRKSPCSDAWAGSHAFEAQETQAVADYMNGTAGERRVTAFVDMHSYGQLFMFPFAHSCDEFPVDAEMLMEAGLGVVKAMRHQHDEEYEAGQACDLTLRAPGDAIDYAYGARDIRWSYSAELRDTGTYGFLLPPHQIRAAGDEVSAGLRFLADFIYKNEIAG